MTSGEYIYIEGKAEQAEQLQPLVTGAENILRCFQLNVEDKQPPKTPEQYAEKERNKIHGETGHEKLLIIVDNETDALVKEALYLAGNKIGGNNFEFFDIATSTKPGEPFPAQIDDKLKTADAVLVVSKFSRTYSPGMVAIRNPQASGDDLARVFEQMKGSWESNMLQERYPYISSSSPDDWAKRIKEQDTHPFEGSPALSRFISMSGVTCETLLRAQTCEAPEVIESRIDKLNQKMKDAEEVLVETGDNYKLSFKLDSSKGLRDDGNVQYQGQGGNFPYGELAFSPDIRSANGFLEVNCAAGGFGVLKESLVLEFVNGMVVDIQGGKTAKEYMELLARANAVDEQKRAEGVDFPSPFFLGEFGIGLNNGIQPFNEDGTVREDLSSLEAEKILNSIHLALGQTAVPWAKTWNASSIHSDMTILRSQVSVRKKDQSEFEPIIADGELRL